MDGSSRQFEGIPKGENDGSSWSVDPDWEATAGLRQDVFGVGTAEILHPETLELQRRFQDEPNFRDIINALMDIEPDRKVRLRDRQ
jgi:hypothetical protein